MRRVYVLGLASVVFGFSGCDVQVENDRKPGVSIQDKTPDVHVTTPRAEIKVDVDQN